MYDPDQQSPVLRLGSIPKTPSLTTSERLAIAERQMEEAIKHWVSATIDYAAERRQSQPISAVRPNVGTAHCGSDKLVSRFNATARDR